MKNKDQSQHDREELHRGAKKALILEALKDGPGFAKDIAQRIGEQPNLVVKLLHEMEDEMVITFTWLRGYKI